MENPQGKVPQRSRHFKKASLLENEQPNQNIVVPKPKQPKSLNFNDVDDIQEKVQNVAQEDPQDVIDRFGIYIDREMEKKSPDDETLTYYTDLIFPSRRSKLMETEESERMDFIKLNHPVLLKHPMQVS